VTYLLDTDTLSIWQHGKGPDFATLLLRLSAHAPDEIGVSIVTLHEQAKGANAYLNQGRTIADLVEGYRRLEDLRVWFTRLNVVPFDAAIGTVYEQLKAAKIRVGTMDLRIAATALARGLTVITRNDRDFAQVPGLKIEDWTR
jgi:tRNA(fMet)-specific endonuclease VapC